MSSPQLRVPDGGWGWYVLAAAATSNFFMSGVIKSISLMMVEVVNELGFTPAEASGIPSIASFVYLGQFPITVMLCSKYTFRSVALCGALLSVSGLIMSGYVTSIYFQYLCIGVMHGLGAGMIFTAGFICVGTYFDKYKGLGNGICLAANSLGGMTMPFLLTYLYDKFGYSGAHLIMGGLLMNCFACPLMYHPVERHMVVVQEKPVAPVALAPVSPLLVTNELDKPLLVTNELDTNQMSSFNSLRDSSFTSGSSYASGLYFADSTYNTVTQNNVLKGTPDLGNIANLQKGPVFPTLSSMWQSEQIQESTLAIKERGIEDQRHQVNMPVIRSDKRSRLTSLSSVAESLSSLRMSNVYLGSSINVLEEEASRRVKSIQKRHRLLSETIDEDKQALGEEKEKKEEYLAEEEIEDVKEKKKKIFDLSILKNTKYLIILISSLTITFSYNNFLAFLPIYSIIELGWDKGNVNLLIFLTNGMDLVGRFTSAIIANHLRFPARYMYITALFLSGILEISFGFNTQFYIFSIVCGFFGLFSGLHIGIMPVMQGEELGAEVLQYSIAIQYFTQAIVSFISPVFATFLANEIGSYGLVYVVFGLVLCLFGAGIYSFYPLAVKREDKKIKKPDKL